MNVGIVGAGMLGRKGLILAVPPRDHNIEVLVLRNFLGVVKIDILRILCGVLI